MAPYSASDIAKYFLWKAEQDEERLSNLKLQKLVFYAQGLHLALEGTPLFDEKIKAWEYGPVVPQLYHDYKKYGAVGIPPDEDFEVESINGETRDFLDDIYNVFGQFSAPRLMEITHEEQCWEDAHPDGEITHAAMKSGLKKYIKSEQ